MSNPRIISGKARGIRLQAVAGDVTRPITDRVKEALFNIIGADIIGSSMFDLFGGTGSVGIEALSRGASYVRFTDNNRGAVAAIRANLKTTRLEENAEVFLIDAFAALRRSPDRVFDYIFIAPPQYKGLWQQAVSEADSNPTWLSSDGWMIVQIDPHEYVHLDLKHFSEFDQRRYGSTLLVFFSPKDLSG